MAWTWLNNIIKKIASEAYKSKIDDFEKRLLEMEQKHQVILKSISEHDNKLEKLDNRVYDSNIQSAKAIGTIDAIIQTGYINKQLLIQDKSNDNNTNEE